MVDREAVTDDLGLIILADGQLGAALVTLVALRGRIEQRVEGSTAGC